MGKVAFVGYWTVVGSRSIAGEGRIRRLSVGSTWPSAVLGRGFRVERVGDSLQAASRARLAMTRLARAKRL